MLWFRVPVQKARNATKSGASIEAPSIALNHVCSCLLISNSTTHATSRRRSQFLRSSTGREPDSTARRHRDQAALFSILQQARAVHNLPVVAPSQSTTATPFEPGESGEVDPSPDDSEQWANETEALRGFAKQLKQCEDAISLIDADDLVFTGDPISPTSPGSALQLDPFHNHNQLFFIHRSNLIEIQHRLSTAASSHPDTGNALLTLRDWAGKLHNSLASIQETAEVHRKLSQQQAEHQSHVVDTGMLHRAGWCQLTQRHSGTVLWPAHPESGYTCLPPCGHSMLRLLYPQP